MYYNFEKFNYKRKENDFKLCTILKNMAQTDKNIFVFFVNCKYITTFKWFN